MSVEFEEQNNTNRYRNFDVPKPKPIVQFIISLGLAKDEESANKILFAITIIFLLISCIIMYIFVVPKKIPPFYYEDLSTEMKNSLPESYLNTLPRKK